MEKKKYCLSPMDVAERLGISRTQAYDLFRSSEFPGFRTGIGGKHGSLRVRAEVFEAWIKEREAKGW